MHLFSACGMHALSDWQLAAVVLCIASMIFLVIKVVVATLFGIKVPCNWDELYLVDKTLPCKMCCFTCS